MHRFDIAAASLTDLQREITRTSRIVRLEEDAHVIVSADLQRKALRAERHARLVRIATQRGDQAAALCGLSLTDLYRQTFSDDHRVSAMALTLTRSRMRELALHARHYATA
jgi:hypothetical protein